MKKMILIAVLAVSAVIYAVGETPATQPGQGMGMQNGMMMNNPKIQGQMPMMMESGACPMMAGGASSGMKGGMMSKGGMMPMMQNMTPEERAAMEKDMIAMEEKNLEVRKMMLNDKPDWKKIEKLNGEVAAMRAKHMTQMMKKMHEGANK